MRRRKLRERRQLLRILPRGGIGAEIGVWEGEMADFLLRRLEPRKLYLIDPWRYAPEYEQARFGKLEGQERMDEIHDAVRERFAESIQAGVVEIRRAESAAAAEEFPDEYFDWVYIDGNHLYEFAKRDLELYGRKVKLGGLLAGDDYGVPGWWEDGVTRAVDEILAESPLEPVLLTTQFVLRVPETA